MKYRGSWHETEASTFSASRTTSLPVTLDNRLHLLTNDHFPQWNADSPNIYKPPISNCAHKNNDTARLLRCVLSKVFRQNVNVLHVTVKCSSSQLSATQHAKCTRILTTAHFSNIRDFTACPQKWRASVKVSWVILSNA